MLPHASRTPCVDPILANKIILSFAGVTISFADPGVARAVVGGGLYLAALAVFTAGLGWLLRSTAGALVTWLASWIVPTLMIMLLPPTIVERVGPWLPATSAPGSTSSEFRRSPPGSAWPFRRVRPGLMGLAAVLLRHRDA